MISDSFKLFVQCFVFFLLGILQQGGAQEYLDPEGTTVLETIVVEAEGNNEDQGDGKAEVLGKEELEYAGIRELESLSGRVANLNISPSSSRSFGDVYTIRGLGNTQFFSNPGVVTYIDGVAQGDAYTFASGLYDVKEVRVHRGPQGSTFGKNGGAGAIEVITHRPTNKPKISGAFSYGSYNTQNYEIALSGPVVKDLLKISLSGYHSRSDGFIENNFLGKKVDERDALGGRIAILLTPGEGLEFEFGINGDRYDDGAARLTALGGDPFVLNSDVETITQIDRNNQYFKMKKEWEWGKITSITSRYDWDISPNIIDINFSSVPGFLSTIDQGQEQWSQELRIESTEEEELISWMAGFYFMTSETKGEALRNFNTVIRPAPFFIPFTVPVVQTSSYDLDEENYALFGEIDIHPVDPLTVTLGMRLDYTEKEIDRGKVDNFGTVFRDIRAQNDFYNISPRIQIEYEVCEAFEVFAGSRYGFKPGGYSAFADTLALAEFDTEKIWANEVGGTLRLLDGKVEGSLVGFWNEIQDYQVERPIPGSTDYIVANAPEVSSKGFELSLVTRPFKGFSWENAFGYTDAQFDRHNGPAGGSVKGNRVPFSPEFTFLSAAQYKHESGWLGRLEFRAIGETYYDEVNTVAFRQAAYGMLNAQIGFEGEWYGVYLFGNNLTDTQYYTNIVTSLSPAGGVPGAPAFIGVRAKLFY